MDSVRNPLSAASTGPHSGTEYMAEKVAVLPNKTLFYIAAALLDTSRRSSSAMPIQMRTAPASMEQWVHP